MMCLIFPKFINAFVIADMIYNPLLRFLSILLACFVLPSCSTNSEFPFLPKEPPEARKIGPIKVALVLGGGGSRSIAQAGVIEVLEANHIPIDLIVGCSAGSYIGAIYADEPNSARLKQKVIKLKKWDLLDPSMINGFKMFWQLNGPVQGHALKKSIQKNIKSKHFNTLKIPLIVVTTDIDLGETFTIQSGSILPAIQASSAVPLVFKPVTIYGRKLVDGGVSSPLPVEVAMQYKPKVIIAVDIGTSPAYGKVNSTYDLTARSLHVPYFYLSKWQAKQADILIHPNIDQYGMFEDRYNQQMYEEGKKAAIKALPEIRRKLKIKSVD